MTQRIIQERASAFDNRTRKQNWLTAVVIGIAVILNLIQLAGGVPLLTRLGIGLMILATTFVVYRYGRAHGSGSLTGEAGIEQSLAFYRSQLVRQRDAVRNFWRDYALPFAPGIALTLAGRTSDRVRTIGDYLVLALVFAVTIAAIFWATAREARKLQAELDALDSTGQS
jgi:hypothetical protein